MSGPVTTNERCGLLVASPTLVDAFFAKAVVLLCDYDEEGALGIVINRPTELDTDKVLAQMNVDPIGGIRGPVLWGGPVQPGAVFLTFSDLPELPDEAGPVFQLSPRLHVTPDRAVIEAVSADVPNEGAVLSLGYAGWAPGQLDGEIQSGSWIWMEADRELVFSTPAEDLHEACIKSIGVPSSMLWMHPVTE
jgi:putative transcriptional regulator